MLGKNGFDNKRTSIIFHNKTVLNQLSLLLAHLSKCKAYFQVLNRCGLYSMNAEKSVHLIFNKRIF